MLISGLPVDEVDVGDALGVPVEEVGRGDAEGLGQQGLGKIPRHGLLNEHDEPVKKEKENVP